jgi:hypothetical protein
LGALLLLAGCASTAVKQLGAVTVPLDAGKTKTEISAKLGFLITLELPPVELAGYGWQVFMLDSRFLRQTTELKPAAAGARQTVTFFAIKATDRTAGGKTTIRFLLTKLDGAKEAQPIDGHDAIFVIE